MKTFTKFMCIAAVASFAAAQARAAILAQDNFSYPDGDLVTVSGGTWTSFSGATALNVVSGQAFETGANSMDDQISIGTGHSNDVLFAGFDVTFNTLSGNQNTYIAHFKDAGTTFFGKVFGSNTVGGVQLGISVQANSPGAALWGSTFALGTTHRIIVELDQSAGWPATAKMWVDPVNEFSTSIQALDTPFPTNVNIVAYALRQTNASTMGSQYIDNLIVGTTFEDVIPEPSTMLLVGTGLVGLLAIRRRRS